MVQANGFSRSSAETPGEKTNPSQTVPEPSKRKSGRNKKTIAGTVPRSDEANSITNVHLDAGPSNPASGVTKRSKKPPPKVEEAAAKDRGEDLPSHVHAPDKGATGDDDSDFDDSGDRRAYDEDDDDVDDPFRAGFLGAGIHPGHISSTLRALTGMVSGVSHRLRDILEKLRQNDAPDNQMVALTELSEILLISTEDNLSGHFSPDQFIKELVSLLKGESGTGDSEMMLLACRCIANMMEALPPSTANVVYGGAVTELIKKLLDIEFIDLAEQALSVSKQFTAFLLNSFYCANSHRHWKKSRSSFLRQLSEKEVSQHA